MGQWKKEKSPFGRRLELLMAENGLTYAAVGEKAGMTRQAVHQFRYSKYPRPITIHRLCKAFGVPVTYFFDALV